MRKIQTRCPNCGESRALTELRHGQRPTQGRSRHTPCAFCALGADQLAFVMKEQQYIHRAGR